MGRPRIYSSEEIIAALVAKKGLVYLAAEMIGCEADTIYRRAEAEDAVKDAMRHQRGKLVDTAEMKLVNALEADAPWAIQMTLRTLGKDRGYFEKQEVDSTNRTRMTMTEEIVDADSPQDDSTPPNPAFVQAQ